MADPRKKKFFKTSVFVNIAGVFVSDKHHTKSDIGVQGAAGGITTWVNSTIIWMLHIYNNFFLDFRRLKSPLYAVALKTAFPSLRKVEYL
jgi:hypothetical protein